MLKRLAGLAVFLSLNACATIIPQKPQVELMDVTLGKVSLTDVQLNVKLDVTNPNSYALNLVGIEYQVDGAGMTLGKGNASEAINLQPGVKQSVTLPLTLTTISALKFGQAYYSPNQKQLPVTLKATVKVDSPVGPLSLNFSDVKDLKEKSR